jgi:3-isopropylmalate/(R)-2-methylmalate dehydratase small subunit
MEKFTTHTGIGVPLRRSNVDTDQIIPAVYLKRVTRTGFEDGLFAAWRNDPSFVLNQEAYAAGSVLVAGPDFGTGSSREHAVWALQNYGFKAVVSPRFADIFRGNAGKAGLLAAQVDEKVVQRLWDHLEAHPGATVTLDLESRTVRAGEGPDAIEDSFDIDDYTRWRLLEGLDDIGITLGHEDAIERYEAARPGFKPATLEADPQRIASCVQNGSKPSLRAVASEAAFVSRAPHRARPCSRTAYDAACRATTGARPRPRASGATRTPMSRGSPSKRLRLAAATSTPSRCSPNVSTAGASAKPDSRQSSSPARARSDASSCSVGVVTPGAPPGSTSR